MSYQQRSDLLLVLVMASTFVLFTAAQQISPPGFRYKIKPKPCQVKGQQGTCMFVWECKKANGVALGMCHEGFMFGSCCSNDIDNNLVPDGGIVPVLPQANQATSIVIENSTVASINSSIATLTALKEIANALVDQKVTATSNAVLLPLPYAKNVTDVTQAATDSTTESTSSTVTTTSSATASTVVLESNSATTTQTSTTTTPSPSTTSSTTSTTSTTTPTTSRTTTTVRSTTATSPSTNTSPSTTTPTTTTTTSTTRSSTTSPTTTGPTIAATTSASTITTTRTTTRRSTATTPTTTTTTTTTAASTTIPTSATTPSTTEATKESSSNDTLLNQFVINGTRIPVLSDYLTALPSNDTTKKCGVSMVHAGSRIVGGTTAQYGAFPWQASVRRTSFFGFSSTHRCGGALLSENWVATAGHCVEDLLLTQIRIRVGEYDFTSTSEKYPHVERGVNKKVVHPKYNFFTYEYDLALVRLEEPVTFAPHIGPICLPTFEDLLIGETGTVTGWGRLSEGGTLPSTLQQVNVPIVSNDKCKDMFAKAGRQEFIPDIFMCAGYETGGRDSCQGDSGGPLQIRSQDGRYFLGGIISWGIGCGEANLPGVCTRISKFTSWIFENAS